MKAFVTGGSGFIGRHVVAKLLERGDEVSVLRREPAKRGFLREAGAELVRGDILDVDSMRPAMGDSDVVFHLAGWYVLGARDGKTKADLINVQGTRNVLGLALELGVPKIVYVSSLVVNGDTGGQIVDEGCRYAGGSFPSHYDRTKWEAHYGVAEPLIEKGAPVVIAMSGVVFGPGDHSIIGEVLRWFLKGRLFFVPGADSGISYVHVEDLAEGLLLAAEKGAPGESYILAGPTFSVGELFELWSQVSGRRAPRLRIPGRFLRPLAPFIALVERIVPLPQMFSAEAVRSLGYTYYGRADKAKRELGWRPRPVRERLEETIAEMRASGEV